MITQIIIIALLVLSIHYTMQPDEIFGKLGDWLEDHLPDAVHPAVFSCNVCMCPHYGSVLYWLIPWQHELWQWPVVVIGAMGVNVAINRLTPEKKEPEPEKGELMIPGFILNAYEKIKKPSFLQSENDLQKEWDALFRYYNLFNEPIEIGCMCYYQSVLTFIGDKISQIELR